MWGFQVKPILHFWIPILFWPIWTFPICMFFTGATAGVKGFANSSVFAMGKFGLRGLAQSLARELHPHNIHIGHFVIDGGIRSERTERKDDGTDLMLDPYSIAHAYLQFHHQHLIAWGWVMELRPWQEQF